MIEKIEIVFQENGRRKKVLLSWLLSQAGQWAYEANPFLIQDPDLANKIKDAKFNNLPAKPQLIARYNYLRTVLNETREDVRIDYTTEDEPETFEHQEVTEPIKRGRKPKASK